MKHIYSILMLISLLFVGTACEDDYRDMVFFTGEAPIYQIGTCDNLIGSVNLYQDKPEGIIVGVDGGDGNYVIINGNDAVVTAAFVKNENGYQRILVTPKGIGETSITVRDGSGSSAMLRVKVDECVKFVWSKEKDGIVVIGEATVLYHPSVCNYQASNKDFQHQRIALGDLRIYDILNHLHLNNASYHHCVPIHKEQPWNPSLMNHEDLQKLKFCLYEPENRLH